MKYAKHIHVLSLIATIPARSPCRRMTCEEANAAFDHMFGYIHEHWAKPLTAMTENGLTCHVVKTVANQHEFDDCRKLLKATSTAEIIAQLETLPPHYAEHIFPVAVARYMVRDLGMPIDHYRCRTFQEFHNRYGAMILGC